MGDLTSYEIEQIISSLPKANFYVLITPHHGTHWHNSLRKIKSEYAVASNGYRLARNLRSEFKETCEKFLSTHRCGDIAIGMRSCFCKIINYI